MSETQYGSDYNREAAKYCIADYEAGTTDGWQPDPEFQEAYAAANPFDDFEKVAGDLLDYEKKPAYLYRMMETAYRKVRPGFKRRPQYQKRGTCVGQGFKNGVDFLMARAALLRGITIPGRAAVCSIYAGSRVEVGGGRIRGDGSNGSWACEWLMKWGVLLQESLQIPQDSISEDEAMAVKWGAPGAGVPAEWEAKSRAFPMKATARCRNSNEAAAAIRNGYPVIICSNLLPSRERDSQGFSKYRRGGGHCTVLVAVRFDRFGFGDLNSWGDFYTGGSHEDQPSDMTYRDADTVDAACQQGDCHILSDINGFERNEKWVNSRF